MNNDNRDFLTQYQELEKKMEELAISDGDVFLPNLAPLESVDYVFICMEPSLGRPADLDRAKERINAGSLNFTSSIEDFILHFCIREYLLKPKEQYHLTDVSKGAMAVQNATYNRTDRYDRWHELLLEELTLVAKQTAGIFAVGNAVANHLNRNSINRPFAKVMHYSWQAISARSRFISNYNYDFKKFDESVNMSQLIKTIESVTERLPNRFRDEAHNRFNNGYELSQSRKELIMYYKLKFENFKAESLIS